MRPSPGNQRIYLDHLQTTHVTGQGVSELGQPLAALLQSSLAACMNAHLHSVIVPSQRHVCVQTSRDP
jgi:hypothetical protein